MKFDVTITERDYLAYNYYHHFHSRAGKNAILLMRLIVPIVLLIIFAFDLLKGFDYIKLISSLIVAIPAIIIWELLVPAIAKYSVRKAINGMKLDGKLPFHETATIELTEDSITERTENSSLTVPYTDITSVGSTNDFFYLYFSSAQAFLIPKKALGSEFNPFVELIKEKTGCSF